MMMHDDSYDDACMMMQLQVRYVRTRTVTQVAPIQDFGVYGFSAGGLQVVVASSHLLHAGGRGRIVASASHQIASFIFLSSRTQRTFIGLTMVETKPNSTVDDLIKKAADAIGVGKSC